MSVHRIKIESDSISAVQVAPEWSGKIDYDRATNSVYFRAKPVGDFTFVKTEYGTIKDAPDCEVISIYLEEKCNDSWVERWRGTFTTYDVRFSETLCRASVAPKTSDVYECLLESYKKDYVVSMAGDIVECRPFAGEYEAGSNCCSDCLPSEPTGPVCSVPTNYCFDKNEDTGAFCPDPDETRWMSCFHRIIGQGTPTTPPPYSSGWTHISGNDWWRCPTEADLTIGVYDEGRWFTDVLEYLVDRYDCSLTVRSHFFGLNATHTGPPSNLAYDFATEKLQAMQVHQKSDIKRPDATNPAQSWVWKMSLQKLLADLEILFQVYWKIDGTDLILEHISYFDSTAGLDLTEKNIEIEYEKKDSGAPNREEFAFADAEQASLGFSEDFAGYPITYGDCGEGTKEYRLNYFTNEVAVITATENAESISDSGFVLIATAEADGFNYILEDNKPLGFLQIHENLYMHNRFFPDGNLNDAPTTFLTTQKTRKMKQMDVKVCCDDGFDPTDYIETAIGQVTVDKVTVDYFQGPNTNLLTIESSY